MNDAQVVKRAAEILNFAAQLDRDRIENLLYAAEEMVLQARNSLDRSDSFREAILRLDSAARFFREREEG